MASCGRSRSRGALAHAISRALSEDGKVDAVIELTFEGEGLS